MKSGLLLVLLPGLLRPVGAMAWEEEPALAFILAWHPVVTAQRGATAAYQPPTWTRRVMEHTSMFVRAASGTCSRLQSSAGLRAIIGLFLLKLVGPVNFPVIAYEFAANRNCSESLAASVGNQKRFHW